ncbi:sensor histidine kinase [Pseudooceanicola sp. 502str34]
MTQAQTQEIGLSPLPAPETQGAPDRPIAAPTAPPRERQGAGPSGASASEDPAETFIYHVTHDLRACFRAMKVIPEWFCEDLEKSAPEALTLVRPHLDMLATQARRGDTILLDLREYSRVGRLSDPATSLTLAALLEEAITLAEVPATFNVEPWLEAPRVHGPRNDLLRLFKALLENAVRHHDRDSGQIWVISEPDGARVSLQVMDDGPGIPERFHERVFQLLTTLKPRDTCEGSGVGLALARKIVEQSGGTISLVGTGSRRGCCFTFSLPAGEAVADTSENDKASATEWYGVHPGPDY